MYHTMKTAVTLLLCLSRVIHCPREEETSFTHFHQLTMHLIQINHECLLYLFTFLDKETRKSVSLTCCRLREVFLDPHLWTLLHFNSPCQLRRNNFVLGPSLHYLAVCWHSSRVNVCNIEDWRKSAFQKDICSKHESLVSRLLDQVCLMCPNLLSLTLSGCGHITDQDVLALLYSSKRLISLHLENCVRITDRVMQAVAAHGSSLVDVRVDFCRNVTQAGLQAIREMRPSIKLSAERSASMIPDSKPGERLQLRGALQTS